MVSWSTAKKRCFPKRLRGQIAFGNGGSRPGLGSRETRALFLCFSRASCREGSAGGYGEAQGADQYLARNQRERGREEVKGRATRGRFSSSSTASPPGVSAVRRRMLLDPSTLPIDLEALLQFVVHDSFVQQLVNSSSNHFFAPVTAPSGTRIGVREKDGSWDLLPVEWRAYFDGVDVGARREVLKDLADGTSRVRSAVGCWARRIADSVRRASFQPPCAPSSTRAVHSPSTAPAPPPRSSPILPSPLPFRLSRPRYPATSPIFTAPS